MFSGVSGLRAHQMRMDVIGNNIANVNTVGFKSSRVTFQEIFNQTLSGAGAPDSSTGRGGTNPMQVGLGLAVGSIDTITTRGSTERTDNPTDLSIQGDGFFIVKGGDADIFKFTRAGNFGLDKIGNLVTGSGLKVYGWHEYTIKPDGTIEFNDEAELEPINLYSDEHNLNKRLIPAKATSYAVLAGNLDARSTRVTTATALNDIGTPPETPHTKVPVTVYDSLGNSYEIEIKFSKCFVDDTDPDNPVTSWYWEVGNASNINSESGEGDTGPASGYIVFDKNGQLIDNEKNAAYAEYNIKPSITLIPDASATGAGPFDVQLDFTQLTMYSGNNSASATNVDGYSTGSLVTFSIDSNGIITGIYSNGQQRPLAMIALARFDNPAGLEKVGENLYSQTTNSGDFSGKGYKPNDGVGSLSPGTLEMSNVDLSREFTDMIITQRGFQANSRIITTSDEMLQELVNLKR